MQMGAGPKGESASKAGVLKRRRSESCAFTILFPLLTAEGGATSRESVYGIPGVFVGCGVPRSDEKGDPRLTRSGRL